VTVGDALTGGTEGPHCTIIVALDRNRVIGKDGDLPWHYSADLKRFKRLTMGGVVIMGRVTWESLPIKPLPGRLNLIVTRRTDEDLALPQGAMACPSLELALMTAGAEAPGRDIWFIGGARLYKEALDQADRVDMTHVPDEVRGDDLVFFPELNEAQWEAGPIETDTQDPRLRRQTYTRRH